MISRCRSRPPARIVVTGIVATRAVGAARRGRERGIVDVRRRLRGKAVRAAASGRMRCRRNGGRAAATVGIVRPSTSNVDEGRDDDADVAMVSSAAARNRRANDDSTAEGGAASSEAVSRSSSTAATERRRRRDSCRDVNGNNDDDRCFVRCGAAVDDIDDHVCGGVVRPSGTTTTTTTTTVAPTATNVDSTARRNNGGWFDDVLLSIQDGVCCGNGTTRVGGGYYRDDNNCSSSPTAAKRELIDIDEVVGPDLEESTTTLPKDDDTNGMYTRVTATGLATTTTTTTPDAANASKITPWWKARKTGVVVDDTYTKKIEAETKLQRAVDDAWDKTITGKTEKAVHVAEEEWRASKKLAEIETARMKTIEDGEKKTTVAAPRRQVTAANKNDEEREEKKNNEVVEVETTEAIVVPIHCGVLHDVDTSKNTSSMMELLPLEMSLAIEELHRSSSLALTRVSTFVPLAFGADVAAATTAAADDTPGITTSSEDSAGIVEGCDTNNGAPTTEADNQLATVNEVEEGEEIALAFVTKTPISDQSKVVSQITNYKKSMADPVSDYVKVGCGSAMMKSLGTRRLISILKSPLKSSKKKKKSDLSIKKSVSMMTLHSNARPDTPRRPSTEGKKDNDIAMDVSVSSKLTKGTRLSTGNIEVTEAEHTYHFDSKMESPNQTSVSDKSVALIANTNSDDGYTVIHEEKQFPCTDLTSLIALKMIESALKGSVAAADTDKSMYSDAVTRHVKNGNPNPTTIVEENQVIEANAFDCGGNLSSILDDTEGVDGNNNDDEDNGYTYGQCMRSGQLNIVDDDIEVATHLSSAKDEDASIYFTDKTVQSADDMSGPTAMMLNTADSCTMNEGITDITDVIQAYSEAYTSAASCVGSAVTEAARENSLAALDEEMKDEDDDTFMSDDRTEATKWTYDTRTTCVTEPATGVTNSTQCRDDTEEEQANNNESVFDSFSAILCCKGEDDEGTNSTAASSRAVNDDDRTYNDYSTVATYTTKATTAAHSYSNTKWLRGDCTVFSNDFQLHGAASTTSDANRCCMLPAWYTQDPTK